MATRRRRRAAAATRRQQIVLRHQRFHRRLHGTRAYRFDMLLDGGGEVASPWQRHGGVWRKIGRSTTQPISSTDAFGRLWSMKRTSGRLCRVQGGTRRGLSPGSHKWSMRIDPARCPGDDDG